MSYFNFKTALIATLMATSSFASDNPTAEDEHDRSTLTPTPMGAGDFDALAPKMMAYLGSCMPLGSLEEAQELVTVCKFFHASFVPYMWFSWTPKGSPIPTGGNFAQSYASRVVMLNLSHNRIFGDIHLYEFPNLTHLDLEANRAVTNGAIMRLTDLMTLNLHFNNRVTDIALQHLTNLTDLNLGSNLTVTKGALMHLTNLNVLNLNNNTAVTNDAVMGLSNLTDLSLGYNSTVTNEGLKSLTNLTTLNLMSNNTVTDDAIKNLNNLSSLILVYNDTVTSAGYAHLPGVRVIDGKNTF